jgi:hypothetical protein
MSGSCSPRRFARRWRPRRHRTQGHLTRTLVVSDLHLGARTGADVLRRDDVRAALLEAVAECDRLVLLGDTLELRHGPLGEVLEVAKPVLNELGGAVGSGGEVVIVPGNHDHRLLRGWLERRAGTHEPPPLGLQTAVEWREGEPLAALAGRLAPATLRAAYPGIWLRDDVYATHGHYADRHNTVPILERLGAGLMARVAIEPDGGPCRAEDYEATLAPMYAWIDTVAQGGGVRGRGGGGLQVRAWRNLDRPRGARIRRAGLAAGFSSFVGLLNRAGLGPLRPDVTAPELRRGGLRAFEEVLQRLGVTSGHAIFGHTHRAGPLPGDDRSEWITSTGVSMLNIGSWTYVRGFLGDSPRQSPYRPGFCAVLTEDGPPELINLLDGLGSDLGARRHPGREADSVTADPGPEL